MCGFFLAEGYGEPSVVGESTWLPKNVLFAYRFIACFSTIIIFSYYTYTGLYSLQFMTVWVLFLSGLSYGIAAISCIAPRSWLAKLTTVCYHVFFTFSILVTPIFWLLEFPDATFLKGVVTLHRLYPHGITAAIFLIDLLLNGQMEFRFFDLIWIIVFGAVYVAFMFIRFGITGDIPYDFLDFRVVGAGRMVLILAGIVLAGIMVGAMLVIVSRVTRLYRKKNQTA